MSVLPASRRCARPGLAVIVLMIAVTSLFNHLNAITNQIAGAWG
jgi:hypothetical protein